MDPYRGQHWRGGAGFGRAGRRPAIEQGGGQQGQAERSVDGGVPVPQGQNPARHARVTSVESVGSWEEDHEYLPLAGRRGGARQETSSAAAPAQQPQTTKTFTLKAVEDMCVQYAANETAMLERRLQETDDLLQASRRRVAELEKSLQQANEKNEGTEAEIAQMSRELASLRLRVPAGTQQAVQQHPRAPTQNFAGLPNRGPPVAPRPMEMQQRRPPLNTAAHPFLPACPALPAPSPPKQGQQQAMVLAPRRPAALPTVPGPARPSSSTPHRLLPGTPGHADDVFDPSIPNRLPWRPAEFEKRPTGQLLQAAFIHARGAVYSQPYIVIPKSKMAGERPFIGLCIAHMDKPKQVYEMLNDQARYHQLISGVMLRMLIEKVFNAPALLDFPRDSDGIMEAFVNCYSAEKEIKYPDPVINDYARRMTIASDRADAAKNVQRLPRFWKWITEKSQLIGEEIAPLFNITIGHSYRAYKDTIVRAANELLRLHVRMLQEPASLYTFEFLGTGFAWAAEAMVNRDPALIGQQIPEHHCPYVTQCTVTPLVTEEKFERTPGSERVFLSKENLLKAEVTLCARRGNLRQ